MGGAVKKLFGGAPKVKAPEPVAVAPIVDAEADKKKAATSRAALYATEGGILGDEILTGGTARRSTLLGN